MTESYTNWQVLTAGPRAGKTTTINRIAADGYKIIPESARLQIDTEISRGRTKEEIYTDPAFQEKVIKKDQHMESLFPRQETIFLDRSIADSIAYTEYFDREPLPDMRNGLRYKYDNIFLLEQLPYEEDYARREDTKEAEEIHRQIRRTYEELGYDVIEIPVNPLDVRVEQIYEHVKNEKLLHHTKT